MQDVHFPPAYAYDPEEPGDIAKSFPVKAISIVEIPPEDAYHILMSGETPPESFLVRGMSWFTLGIFDSKNPLIDRVPNVFVHFTGIALDIFSTREKANVYLWKVREKWEC